MSNWRWIKFERAKPHMVSVGLASAIIGDMHERDHAVEADTEASALGMDMPGMVAVNRPWETFRVAGLKIEIPSEDVASFIGLTEKLQERRYSKRVYYKLHDWTRCLVLTPGQRDKLLSALKSRVMVAERRATVFYADKKSAAQVLREAAAKVHGCSPDEIPDLGGHKNDRFFVKGGAA